MRRETSYSEVHDSQRYFRLLMDSMSRPGTINNLFDMDLEPPVGLSKASALIALSLLNSDVVFHYDGENRDSVNKYILMNTSSSPVDLQYADFLFIDGSQPGDVIAGMKVGTLSYPEEGGTVVIDVARMFQNPVAESLKITLRGPGVDGEKAVFVSGLSENILRVLADVNNEFPLGVDTILADRENNILCIPRSNKFSWSH